MRTSSLSWPPAHRVALLCFRLKQVCYRLDSGVPCSGYPSSPPHQVRQVCWAHPNVSLRVELEMYTGCRPTTPKYPCDSIMGPCIISRACCTVLRATGRRSGSAPQAGRAGTHRRTLSYEPMGALGSSRHHSQHYLDVALVWYTFWLWSWSWV
jgi:hypothetical protein